MHTNAIFTINKLTIRKLQVYAIFGVFCPFDFGNGFRGHSRSSKRAKIDYTFTCRAHRESLRKS